MDFITKLPQSQGNDTILTITDHDCSKATLLFPCKETISAEEVTTLYATHVFPYYGIPQKIITNQDPQFTSFFSRELFKQLGITKNMSTTYHLQTDRQSEQTNQWVEQYLQIFGNTIQIDWANWLPLAQYTHNSWVNKSTKQIPFKLLIGGLLSGHHQISTNALTNESWEEQLRDIHNKANRALKHAQWLLTKHNKTNYQPHQEGDKVWLEATNLKTSHPTAKLALRRYRPFRITKKISDIIYQIELPQNWHIHNMFHISLLTLYWETEIHGPNYHEPPPEIIEGEPKYKAEAIIGSQRVGMQKELQYCICWKGYSPAHDSWEPADQVYAPKLIKKYQMTKLKRKLQIKITESRLTSAMMTEAENPITMRQTSLRPRPNPSNEDKKDKEKDKITINSCIMSSPTDWAFNNIIQLTEATEAKMNLSNTENDKGTMQVESPEMSTNGSTSDYRPTPEVLLIQSLVQNPELLNMAAALFKY